MNREGTAVSNYLFHLSPNISGGYITGRCVLPREGGGVLCETIEKICGFEILDKTDGRLNGEINNEIQKYPFDFPS